MDQSPEGLSWGKRLAPMILLQIYLTITVLMFAFGPWKYPIRHPEALYEYIVGFQVALALGYVLVAHGQPRDSRGAKNPVWYITIGLIVTAIFFPLTTYARTGHWVPDFVSGLRDPAAAYLEAMLAGDQSSNFAAYARILAAPALSMLFPLVAFYWVKLSQGMRLAFWALVVGTVLLSFATAQRRDIADFVAYLPLVAIASHWAHVSRFKPKKLFLVLGLSIGGLILLVGYFLYSHVQRIGAEAAAYSVNPITMESPDPKNPMLADVPESVRPGVAGLINYLSTGYYGLALSLDRDFEPMYGAGHSIFLTRNVTKLTKQVRFEHQSYAVQISDKDNFKYPIFWATAYPYFANDVSFPGTILLMGVFGAVYALVWLDMLGGKNPYAVVFFSHLAILMFYLPATNRMLQDGEGVVSTYFWLILWLWDRYRRTSKAAT